MDDLADYGRKVTAAGGSMVVENQEVPGLGSISLFLGIARLRIEEC